MNSKQRRKLRRLKKRLEKKIFDTTKPIEWMYVEDLIPKKNEQQ